MFTAIIKKTVGYWVDNEIIDDFDRDIYEYGFELILSTIINIAAVMISALFVNRVLESVALLMIVIPLQSCGGGYHAKTHLNCFLIMYIGWWVVIGMIPYVTLFLAILIACISMIIIFVLAPVSHENVPMSEQQFHKMKILVRCFSVGAAVIGIAVSWLAGSNNNFGNSVIIGMGVVALSMLVARMKR